MQPAAVADAGGLLVLAGLLEGVDHEVDQVLVLDATSLLVAEYLALHPRRRTASGRNGFGLVRRVVSEWFPVRAVAIEAAIVAIGQDDVDGLAALALRQSLDVPIITKNGDLASRKIAVLYC